MLVPVFRDRPTIIKRDGWTIFVSVADADYFKTKRQWLQKRIAAHPDKGGSSDDFTKITARYDQWRDYESLRYASYGLLPPDGYVSSHEGVQKRLQRSQERSSEGERPKLLGKARRKPQRRQRG